MKNLFLFIALMMLLTCQACKPSDQKAKDSVLGRVSSNPQQSPQSVLTDLSLPENRKLTKEATVSFETGSYKKTSSAIKNLIVIYKGQINNESVNIRENEELHAVFVLRIPAKSFEQFLNDLGKVEGKIVNKDINIQDITAEYMDVEAKIKSKKELEARYIQLLAKATKITEMLEIEKQLNIQRTQIDSIEGRFKFMQHEVAYNLLTIDILETKNATSGFFGKVFNAMGMGWTFLLQVLVFILAIWPLILFGCLVWFLIIRFQNQNEKKRKILFEESLKEKKDLK